MNDQATPAVSPTPNPADLATWKAELVTCSPDEEFAARAQRWGWPERLDDKIVAAFLLDSTTVTVRPDGIRLVIGQERPLYWREDSILIQEAFQGALEVPAKLDPNDLTVIHLFRYVGDPAKRNLAYVESIARYIAPAFTDKDAMAEVLAAKKRQINRLYDGMQQDHQIDTEAAAQREIRNADKLQRIRTFPLATGQRSSASTKSHGDAAPAGNDRPRELDALGGDQARHLLPEQDADLPASSAPRQPASPEFSTDSVADEEVPALNPEPRSLTGAAPTISRALPSSDPASRIAAATAHARTRVATVADQQRAAADAIADVEQTARRSRRQRIAAKYGQPVS
jgi:hypothetical protein